MKVITKIIIVCVICFVFTACEPGFRTYHYDDLKSNIVSVELIKYDNPKAKDVPDHFGNAWHRSFDFKKMEYMGALDEELYYDFFKDISGKTILDHVWHKNSPNGICVKMNYENGDFEIVSYDYVGKFSARGKSQKHLGGYYSKEFIDIMYNYFDVKLDIQKE